MRLLFKSSLNKSRIGTLLWKVFRKYFSSIPSKAKDEDNYQKNCRIYLLMNVSFLTFSNECHWDLWNCLESSTPNIKRRHYHRKTNAMDKLAEIFRPNSRKYKCRPCTIWKGFFREFEFIVCGHHHQKKKIRSLSNQTSRYHLFRTWTV